MNETRIEKVKRLLKEKDEIQAWFARHDWKANKIVTGEWTTEDERWQAYMEQRKAKRARLDEINAELHESVKSN